PGDPVSQALGKFYGEPPPQPEDGQSLNGYPASPGKARGRAVVLHSLAEAERVQPGDILVADTTSPPWTALFASLAGLVTDTGGVLSHAAIVAREYRIPAVVGVGKATATIKEGQIIEIDGDTGVIRLLPADAVS
ncbi:MAG: PEP-utilizing enzyme, partial [Candidatus Competibacterales bacterium]